MSVRVEWAASRDTAVQWARRGAVFGEDEVTHEGAVVFSGDTVFVVEGSVANLQKFAQRVQLAVNLLATAGDR